MIIKAQSGKKNPFMMINRVMHKYDSATDKYVPMNQGAQPQTPAKKTEQSQQQAEQKKTEPKKVEEKKPVVTDSKEETQNRAIIRHERLPEKQAPAYTSQEGDATDWRSLKSTKIVPGKPAYDYAQQQIQKGVAEKDIWEEPYIDYRYPPEGEDTKALYKVNRPPHRATTIHNDPAIKTNVYRWNKFGTTEYAKQYLLDDNPAGMYYGNKYSVDNFVPRPTNMPGFSANNKEGQEVSSAAREWLANYYSHPSVSARYEKNFSVGGYNTPYGRAKTAQHIRSIPVIQQHQVMHENAGDVHGMVKNGKAYISMDSDYDPEIITSHEIVHGAGFDKYVNRHPVLKELNDWYFEDQFELIPRLISLKYELGLKPDQKVTPDMLQKIKQTDWYKKDPSHKEMTDDDAEELIKALNLVQNNNNRYMNYAKYGMRVNKYQEGDAMEQLIEQEKHFDNVEYDKAVQLANGKYFVPGQTFTHDKSYGGDGKITTQISAAVSPNYPKTKLAKALEAAAAEYVKNPTNPKFTTQRQPDGNTIAVVANYNNKPYVIGFLKDTDPNAVEEVEQAQPEPVPMEDDSTYAEETYDNYTEQEETEPIVNKSTKTTPIDIGVLGKLNFKYAQGKTYTTLNESLTDNLDRGQVATILEAAKIKLKDKDLERMSNNERSRFMRNVLRDIEKTTGLKSELLTNDAVEDFSDRLVNEIYGKEVDFKSGKERRTERRNERAIAKEKTRKANNAKKAGKYAAGGKIVRGGKSYDLYII